MASIYDFDGAFLNYRNKQRLNGGQIDPRVVGALAEADLNARYADQKTRRSQDLQQQQINNNYDIANRTLAQNASLANQQTSAQKQAGLYSMLASLPTITLTGYKMGQDAGLWGKQAPTPLEQAQTNYYNSLVGLNNNSQPSIPTFNVDIPSYDYTPTSFDTTGNDISMALGDQTGDASNTDTSWISELLKWVF